LKGSPPSPSFANGSPESKPPAATTGMNRRSVRVAVLGIGAMGCAG